MNKHIAILGFFLTNILMAGQPKSTPQLLEQGKAAFKTNCVSCHGPGGEGNGELAKILKPPPRNLVKDPLKQGTSVGDLFKTITGGVKGTGMAGYGHLNEKDRWALAYFVSDLRSKK